MKTTLDLPDGLMREVKIRAINENRKLKDMIADLLRRGMDRPDGPSAPQGRRVQLPLVLCAHDASPETEMSPHRVAEVLLREDAESASPDPLAPV